MVVVGAAMWVVTMILPLTFVILMAWGCHTRARQQFRVALEYYSGQPAKTVGLRERAATWRTVTRSHILAAGGLGLSIVLPVTLLVMVTHVPNTQGVGLGSALGLLLAIALVLAASVYGRPR